MNDNKEIIITGPLKGLEESKASKIQKTFAPMVEMLNGFESSFGEVVSLNQEDPETAKKAKRLRLDISKVRIETGKLKDKQKEYIKLEDKAIMGVHNILVWAVKEKEDKLKEIETYAERKEQERVKALESERICLLAEYEVDGETLNLGVMSSEVWENYLAGTKAHYLQQKEAERKAEEERAEEERKTSVFHSRREKLLPLSFFLNLGSLTVDTTEEEFKTMLSKAKQAKADKDKDDERIRIENERLRSERERQATKERAEAAKRAKKETEERRKREEEKQAQEKRLAEERRKREEAEAIAMKAKEEKAAEEKRKTSASDVDKIKNIIDDVVKLEFKTKEADKAANEAVEILIKYIKGIK